MRKKIVLCSFVVSLILILWSGSCFGKGLHFGIISAVQEKIRELNEKIQEREVTHYKSTTGTDGIARFTLKDGRSASVKALDLRTGQPVSGIVAYLITDGIDGAYLLIDPEGRYAPRLVDAVNPAPAPSAWVGLIREVVLSLLGRITGDHPEPLTSDRIPLGLSEYVIRNFYFFWRSCTFEELDYTLNDLLITVGEKLITSLILPFPIQVAGWVVTFWETSQAIQAKWWATYYYTLGYEPSDVCEIWRGRSDKFFSPPFEPIVVLPKTPLPSSLTFPTGSISGRVVDARTGQGLANVELSLIPGNQNAYSQSFGSYSFLYVPVISPRYYTMIATKVGYDPVSISNIQVSPNEETTVNIALNPAIISPIKKYRIVLTWGENPRDLDSHLWTPSIEGSTYHIYYVNKGSLDLPPYANLDVDDTTSYGPETVTIDTPYPGTYTYAVHHYSFWPDDAGTITTSEAVVKVYDQEGLLRTFYVPTIYSGTGWWWRVFTLDGSTGGITEVNTITADSPIAYTLVPVKKKSK